MLKKGVVSSSSYEAVPAEEVAAGVETYVGERQSFGPSCSGGAVVVGEITQKMFESRLAWRQDGDVQRGNESWRSDAAQAQHSSTWDSMRATYVAESDVL